MVFWAERVFLVFKLVGKVNRKRSSAGGGRDVMFGEIGGVEVTDRKECLGEFLMTQTWQIGRAHV